jgi:citrate synthase
MGGRLLLIGRLGGNDRAPDARAAVGVTLAAGLDSPEDMDTTTRSYSPGLKGVLAGETALAMIDGEAGRLQYRGYPIGELVERGTYAQVAELLWTGEWRTDAHLACAPIPTDVIEVLRRLPASTTAMDALRTAISTWGAVNGTRWPPTVEQARAITAAAPTALAAFARLRDGIEPIEPDPELGLAAGFL